MDIYCSCNYSSKGHTFSLYLSFLKHICFWCCTKHHRPTCITHKGVKKSASFCLSEPLRVDGLSLSNLRVFCLEVACSRPWAQHDVTHPWAGRRGKHSLLNQTLSIKPHNSPLSSMLHSLCSCRTWMQTFTMWDLLIECVLPWPTVNGTSWLRLQAVSSGGPQCEEAPWRLGRRPVVPGPPC